MKKQDEFYWLNNVSNGSLQATCKLLEEAYVRFFNGVAGYPNFKSKKNIKQSYQIRNDCMYFKQNNILFIQKVGNVKYKSDFIFETGLNIKHYNVRLHFRNNKYIISFTMDCDSQAINLTTKRMGIDLGVKKLAVVALENEKFVFENINKSKKIKMLTEKEKYYQHIISRKYTKVKNDTGKHIKSKNITKYENKLRKVRNRRTNIKDNYVHQITAFLTNLRPAKVVMETLNLEHMLKDKYLRKSIQDSNFYEFKRQMEYKCENKNIEFILADRYYPSSKICSNCGCVKEKLKLSERKYICSKCGFTIDRDYNAAINLMRYEA